MHKHQRQPKGKPLKTLFARVDPETYAWLSDFAGDSSLGVALDHLRELLSSLHSDSTK